ncbi:MAG TPA: nuclear transport factor 2 family protein [Terriglobia bacterium]|nr:nuclear transport factor 2 family protein [Terriglobia bacterium]
MARTSGKKSASGSRRRAKLDAATAKRFLATYKEVWETRNAELAASLFTRDAHYWENPFGKPIVGREDIAAYWKKATEKQDKIQFGVVNFFLSRYALFAEWTCSYTHRPTSERRELAGILLADFYGKQVRTFREYWHRRVV